MKINIVDYIGVHCGMHYYNEAFEKTLQRVEGDNRINIISNYSATKGGKAFFLNQYRGALPLKVFKLCCNLVKLLFYLLTHRQECYIYLTYGNRLDLLFMPIIALAPRHIIDIHEAVAQSVDSDERLKGKFKALYSKRIKSVISHSNRTLDFLKEYDYNGKILNVPHFKYCFQKEYDITKVEGDALHAIAKEKINLLFFGNINHAKGVDIFIDAVNRLEDRYQSQINVIIAGKNSDDSIHITKPLRPELFNLVVRHINDDELVYLYHNCDYVVLPYRKTSQSGILEMAFYFQKPIIANNVAYFKRVLSEFPTFGALSEGLEPDQFKEVLMKVIDNHKKMLYFEDSQYGKFTNREEINTFIYEFTKWLIN